MGKPCSQQRNWGKTHEISEFQDKGRHFLTTRCLLGVPSPARSRSSRSPSSKATKRDQSKICPDFTAAVLAPLHLPPNPSLTHQYPWDVGTGETQTPAAPRGPCLPGLPKAGAGRAERPRHGPAACCCSTAGTRLAAPIQKDSSTPRAVPCLPPNTPPDALQSPAPCHWPVAGGGGGDKRRDEHLAVLISTGISI